MITNAGEVFIQFLDGILPYEIGLIEIVILIVWYNNILAVNLKQIDVILHTEKKVFCFPTF